MHIFISKENHKSLITESPSGWTDWIYTPSKGFLVYKPLPGEKWCLKSIASIVYYLCFADKSEVRFSVRADPQAAINFYAKIEFFQGRQPLYTLLQELYFVDIRKNVRLKRIYTEIFLNVFQLSVGEWFQLPLGKWGYILITKLSELSGENNA